MRLKRVISAALAVSMAVSMVPATAVTAFATDAGNSVAVQTAEDENGENAAQVVAVTVDSFETGKLKEAVEAAAKVKGVEVANITSLTISGGTLSATDFEYLSGVSVANNGGTYNSANVDLSSMTALDLSGIQNTNIPALVFFGNGKIEHIVLPKNLDRIGYAAFAKMSKLNFLSTDETENLYFEGLKIIGESIVYKDSNLKGNLHLPDTLEQMGASSFEGSGVGGSAVIAGNANIVDNADASETYPTCKRVFYETNIESLKFGDGIKIICEDFASSCLKLKEVVFSNTVSEIKHGAFAGSGLTGTLVLPASVKTVGSEAFNRCPENMPSVGDAGLDNIIVENPEIQLTIHAFWAQKEGTKIYFTSEKAAKNEDSYWEDDKVVILNTDGGKVNTEKSEYGLFIPEKEGYTFKGWTYTENGELKTVESENDVVAGKTYTASWTKNKYTVTLDNNGHGKKPADETIEHGVVVTDLPKLTDDANEWVFTGWYTDADCTTEYKDEPITKATTLYAGWRAYENTYMTAKVSKGVYLVNTPAEVNVTVTPGDDIDELQKNMQNVKVLLTYDDDVTSVTLNDKELDKKEYTIRELMELMGQNQELKLNVTYGKIGTHTFKIALKNGDNVVSECGVDIVVGEKAADLTPATKVYDLTIKNADVTIKNGDEELKAEKNDKGELTAKVPEGAEVTVSYTSQSDAVVFDQWTVTTDAKLDVDVKSNPLTFKMPADGVTVEVMTKDASIEEEPNVLGTAAVIGTAAVGTAVLAWQGYQLGTELYLKYALPAGAAIPTNCAELALLVWNNAGKPEPVAVLPEDATDTQKALTWAAENELIPNGKGAEDSVSKIDVIRSWNKAQEK